MYLHNIKVVFATDVSGEYSIIYVVKENDRDNKLEDEFKNSCVAVTHTVTTTRKTSQHIYWLN